MLLTGISIRTRSECLDFQQVGTWWQQRARIISTGCMRQLMPPTKKVAARILPSLFTRGTCGSTKKKFELNPAVPVTKQTPPTFLLQAEDDPVDSVNHSLVYYVALKKAGVPVEMHLYAHGGHAFGLRRTKFPITAWPGLVETWLGTIGMIPK